MGIILTAFLASKLAAMQKKKEEEIFPNTHAYIWKVNEPSLVKVKQLL